MGIPPLIGSGLFLVCVAWLTYSGSQMIEIALSWWSYVLYAVYIYFLYVGLSQFGGVISANFAAGTVKPGWALGGFQYAFYNVAVTSTVLFSLNYLETRREAIISGIVASLICVLPALFFYVVTIGFYPDVLNMEIPANAMIAKMGVRFLLPVWLIVLFGTMIETGVGFFHSINERINSAVLAKRGTGISKTTRGLVGIALTLMGLAISNFGLIGLIAKGYGTISWFFFILQGVALFTIGIWKIKQHASV